MITFEDSDYRDMLGEVEKPTVNLLNAKDSFAAAYPRFVPKSPIIIFTSVSSSVDSFKRAQRKAYARGLRLLSYHFKGARFVAQFGV